MCFLPRPPIWSQHARSRLTTTPLSLPPSPSPSLSHATPPSSHSCHPERRWDDGSIPKRPDESSRRHSGQHGRMSGPSRGRPFLGDDGHCWNLWHSTLPTEGERFWENTGRDRGVEAGRNGTIPLAWCPISLVSTFCLAKKKKKKTHCPCLFPTSTGYFIRFSHFAHAFLGGERPRGLHFEEDRAWWVWTQWDRNVCALRSAAAARGHAAFVWLWQDSLYCVALRHERLTFGCSVLAMLLPLLARTPEWSSYTCVWLHIRYHNSGDSDTLPGGQSTGLNRCGKLEKPRKCEHLAGSAAPKAALITLLLITRVHFTLLSFSVLVWRQGGSTTEHARCDLPPPLHWPLTIRS